MGDAPRPGALAARDPSELLHAVVAEVGESLDLWSVDLWAFSEDADTLECRAFWCREPSAVQAGDCVGAVVGLDQSHDLRRLVLAAEVVERHLGDDLSPDDTAALTQAGFTSRIDVPLLAGAEVLGVLSLAETRAVRRLSPDERARLGTLARLAAAVLRATRLYEAETQRAERLTALLVTGHGLSASLSAQEIVAAVRAEAARLIGGVACVAEVVLRQDDGTFVRVAPSGEAAGEAWRADALARQAADLGRPEQGRTADGRARLMLPLASCGTHGRLPRAHGAPAEAVPGVRGRDSPRCSPARPPPPWTGRGPTGRCRADRPRTHSPASTAAGTSTSGCTPRSPAPAATVSRWRWSPASWTARRGWPDRAARRSATRCSSRWRGCC